MPIVYRPSTPYLIQFARQCYPCSLAAGCQWNALSAFGLKAFSGALTLVSFKWFVGRKAGKPACGRFYGAFAFNSPGLDHQNGRFNNPNGEGKMKSLFGALAAVLLLGVAGCATAPKNVQPEMPSSIEMTVIKAWPCDELAKNLEIERARLAGLTAAQKGHRRKDMAVGWLAGPGWLGLTKDAEAPLAKSKGLVSILEAERIFRCSKSTPKELRSHQHGERGMKGNARDVSYIDHKAFSNGVTGYFIEKTGVCGLMGLDLVSNPDKYGSAHKRAYTRFRDKIAAKHGNYKEFNFPRHGSVYDADYQWLLSLRRKERTLAAVWSAKEDSTLPDGLEGIKVEADALFIKVKYEFANQDECIAAGEAIQLEYFYQLDQLDQLERW